MFDQTHNGGTNPDDPRGDVELLAAYSEHGDAVAFGVLVRRYERELTAMAQRILWDQAEADDVVQTVWLKVIRSAGTAAQFAHRSKLSTWLWTITRNEALTMLRRRVVRRQDLVDGTAVFEVPDPGDAIASTDARVLVEELVGRLPEAQRVAIELVWLRSLSMPEAAEVLDVPLGTVKTRVKRGREAMARALTTTRLPHEADDGRMRSNDPGNDGRG